MTNSSMFTDIPQNTNIAQTNKFVFMIPKLPNVNFFMQSFIFPGMATNEVVFPTPTSDIFAHGDKLVYDPITVSFLVDEDYRSWEDVYNWLSGLTYPLDTNQYIRAKNKTDSLYYDGYLQLNTNSHKANIRVKFVNCHPISLSSIQFNVFDSPDLSPICDVTLRYDHLIVERNI